MAGRMHCLHQTGFPKQSGSGGYLGARRADALSSHSHLPPPSKKLIEGIGLKMATNPNKMNLRMVSAQANP